MNVQTLIRSIEEHNEEVAAHEHKRVLSESQRRQQERDQAERKLREKYARAIASLDRPMAIQLLRELGGSPDPTKTVDVTVDEHLALVAGFESSLASLQNQLETSVADRAYALARQAAIKEDEQRVSRAKVSKKRITCVRAHVSAARGFLGARVIKALAELDEQDREAVEREKAAILERFDFIPTGDGVVPVRKRKVK